MGTELFDEKGELPAIKRFWGGDDRGQCIQLTKKEPLKDGGFMFITIPIEDIPVLIARLQSVQSVQSERQDSGSIIDKIIDKISWR